MHGMKSEMELADEEYKANLAKETAMDANEKEGRNPSAMREALTKIKNLADDYEQCGTKAGALDSIYDLANAALSAPPEPPSNPSAMREALLKASDALTEAVHHNLTEEYINECLALIHAALAAPSEPPSNIAAMREALEFAEDELWAHGAFDSSKRVAAALAATPKPPSDADKMREALESCYNFIVRIDRPFNPFMQNLLETAVAKAKAALAAPPHKESKINKMNTQNEGEGNAYTPISSISNNAQLNNGQTECNTPVDETSKKPNGEATVCTHEVEPFRTEWPKMPHPENDKDCDNLCGVEDLNSTITADVCLDLALSCETPSFVHKAEGDWVRYILETCKVAAMECGHLWFNFGLRGKIDWNTVGQMIEERGFEVTFFDEVRKRRYKPGCPGGIPGSVDSMNVYWGRRNKIRQSTHV